MKNKEKKEKVKYYDDGSTISDMSLVGKKKTNTSSNTKYTHRATEKEKLHTFFEAFKMMLIPTAVVLSILLILYFILMLIV